MTILSSPSTWPNCRPASGGRAALFRQPQSPDHLGRSGDRPCRASVRCKAGAVPLTAREWVLFEAFLQRPGQLLSKAQLEERLYSFDTEIESNTIEVHVSRLRKKLGHGDRDRAGLGYRLGSA